MSETQTDFAHRHRLMTERNDALALAEKIRSSLRQNERDTLARILQEQHPADLADAMLFLNPSEDIAIFQILSAAEAAEVLDEVDENTRTNLLQVTPPGKTAEILNYLPPDESAFILRALSKPTVEKILDGIPQVRATDIRFLLKYPRHTAGSVMSLGFVAVPDTATQAEAVACFCEKREAEQLFFVYVIDTNGRLCGAIDLRTLLTAASTTPVRELMNGDVVAVLPDCDQEQVAQIFSRYDLTALPVVSDEPDHFLLGVITPDDIIDVLQEEIGEDVAHMSGSDAGELESKSPLTVAKLRLPWIMATMFIELLAGFVIHYFDKTLTKYILLASFMPIISAISGNTGLQSAAIIIRGLSTGHVQLAHWRHAVLRQLVTTMLLGGACAVVLGSIGAIWDRHWSFGLTVFLGMFLAVNIAGVVGTVVPLLSKRAGFDPALTAGPFETAFQDVVGISLFLGLATLLLQWFK